MSIVTLHVSPGEADYDRLYQLWVRDGKGSFLDERFHERIWRVEYPNGPADPQFLLMSSLPGATSPDLTSPLSGVQAWAMSGTRTWHGNRIWPKQ